MMKNKRKPIKTKISEIIDYWIRFEDECDLNFDWSEANTICWRCGCERKLERCHIIPYSLGGKDEPSNFVLLCSECHQEAPNVESKTFMWDWIKSYHCPFYNTFWQKRAIEEYERIYHKDFYDELFERDIITDHAIFEFWNLKTGKTSYHFGHPYGNVSTIAGNYKLHLDAFDKKYPNGKYSKLNSIEREKDFEALTNRICELAVKYNFSVWEGASRNPYSLCIYSFFPKCKKYWSISIKMKKDGYFMCVSNETNPNNIPVKSFIVNIGDNQTLILKAIQVGIKEFISTYGKPKNEHPVFFVIDPHWRRKNEKS